jgi:hypothetical protein
MNHKKHDYFASTLFDTVCTPLWEWDKEDDQWVAVGFWVQELIGWKLLKEGPCPVVSTGVKCGGSIFMDQRGQVEFPSRETFQSIEDALRHINEGRG